MSEKNISRRSFLQILTTSALAAPALFTVGNLFAATKGAAGALPAGAKKLDENAPMAKALGFKHDAKAVDKVKYKKFQDGQNCVGCAQYIQKNEGFGECKIIKGGLVAAGGWCNSFLAKAK